MVSRIKTAAAWLASTRVSLPLYVEGLMGSLVGRKKNFKVSRWLLPMSAQETNCDPLSTEVVKSQLDSADSRSFQNLLDCKSCVVELRWTGATTTMQPVNFKT